jgi:class 3 adenylate cyclase
MQKFYGLIDQYNSVPATDVKKIEQEIWDNYGVEKTVLCLDMSGFSLLVQRYGIVHYLSMIRRMQQTTAPIVKQFQGQVVKYEADNLFAVFDDAALAVQAATSINIALNAMNIITEDSRDLFVSIGLAKGKIILIPQKDMFGDAVNIASKMGEDLAQRSEILITKEVHESAKDNHAFKFEEVDLSVSGLKLKVFKVLY